VLAALFSAAPAAAAPARPAGKVVYPKLVKLVRAPYPDAARKAGTLGVVLLFVTVGTDGKVQAVSVARSLTPELDAADA
jgi:outer membrane biosynthesis protein TonB